VAGIDHRTGNRVPDGHNVAWLHWSPDPCGSQGRARLRAGIHFAAPPRATALSEHGSARRAIRDILRQIRPAATKLRDKPAL
jgi:hypothetical protein